MVKSLALIGEYEKALAPAEDYTKHVPADFEGHYLLDSYRGLGQLSSAKPELLQAAKMNPDHSDLQYNLGLVLFHLGHTEALPHFERAIELDPKNDSAKFQFANALKALKQEDRADQIYEQVRNSKQQSMQEDVLAAKGNEANSLLQAGQVRQASAIYREMIELDPRNAHTQYNLAITLDKLGD